MEKLKTGVIGAGKVGHFHAHAYIESPYSEFAGVWNRTPERAEAFAKQYGVKAYSSIEDMAKDGIQAVSICTPHPNHCEAAVRAGVPWVMDIFTPHYGTDCDPVVAAGYDVRHGAIGPGTANSHGYERTHLEGLKATHDLLAAYLGL